MEQQISVNHGIKLEGDSVSFPGGKVYRLGQRVYSNGRFAAKANTLGLIVEFREPYDGAATSNVIGVWWEGHIYVEWMKPKDLLPPSLQPK